MPSVVTPMLNTIRTIPIHGPVIPPSTETLVFNVTLKHHAPIRLWSTPQEFKITYTVPTSYRHTPIHRYRSLLNLHSIETYPLSHLTQHTQYQMYMWETLYGPIYYHQLQVPYKGYTLWSVENIYVKDCRLTKVLPFHDPTI